jgi:orotate phosphoribosyltransferase
MTTASDTLAQDFVRFAIDCQVLRFGEFTTKAGRLSPYFFNAGLFDDGVKLQKLAAFYAQRILQQEAATGERADMLFGPAYKGIPLVAAVAIELARLGRNLPFAYNRKEAKDHGEGGSLVGAPLRGKVMIVDDVMSAGTAVRESIALIENHGAQPWGVAVALDRQEKAVENGQISERSAVQFVRQKLGLQVWVVATLADLLQYLQTDTQLQAEAGKVAAYRQQYGVL